MTKTRRTQILVDPKVQGALIMRVIGYWLFCLLTICLMVFIWAALTRSVESSGEVAAKLWREHFPTMLASLIVLPIVLVDVVRMSNRFVGPIYNLRNAMVRLSRGENVQPVHFRQNDYWADMAAAFNAIHDQLERNTHDPHRSGVCREPELEEPVSV